MMPATPRSSSIPQAAATSPNARCRVRSGMICRSRASSSASISAAVPTYRSETIFGRPPTRAISRKYQYVLPLIFFGYRLAINLGHTPEQPRGQAPNQRATSRNASASASHWASDNHDHRKLRLGGGGARAHRGLPQSWTVASTDSAPPAACHNRAMTAVLMRRANLARLAAGPAALAVGLGALAVAQGPGRLTTYAGRSGLAATLTVAAGLALVVAGLVTAFSHPAGRIGDPALLAGLVWFAPVWVGWDKGPPLVRTLGMLAAGFAFPLLLHLVVAYPSGRLRGAVARALVSAVYLEAALAALGRALFRDPFFDPDCWANCTDKVFLLRSLPPLARGIEVADRWFTAAAATALVTLCACRLLRDSGPARRALLPVALPAILLAATVVAHAIALQRRPLEDPSDPAFRAIFVIGCVAVLLLAAGLVWAAVRMRVQRRAVARIATSLGQAPRPGSLQAALAQAVGDPDLKIAYWLPDSQRHVDANGRPVAEPVAAPGRALTALIRDRRQIAVVSHTAALPDLERELGAAVRLALENERLQAEVLAQLGDLRASRVRIIETGDTERRRPLSAS